MRIPGVLILPVFLAPDKKMQSMKIRVCLGQLLICQWCVIRALCRRVIRKLAGD